MFDANHDLCVLEFVNDVNVRSKSKSSKRSKTKTTYKPTGKVFTDIGYRWKPTRQTFTIDGNTCPLTRITSTKVVPLKETTTKSAITQNPEIKDEVPEFMIKFIRMIQVRLNATVRNIRTDNGTEFVNQTLKPYYEDAPLFLWAEAIVIPCYTQNRSLIHKRHNKIAYELLHNKKPNLSYLYVFGALCYPNNDSEDLGKLKPKADIGIFIGHAQNPPSPTPYVPPTKNDWDLLFQLMFDEHIYPSLSVASPIPAIVAQEPADLTGTLSSTSIDQDAPSPSNSQTPPKSQYSVIPPGVEEEFHDTKVAHFNNDPFFGVPILEPSSK
ncbi:retrovirus-related pol polyprotein from transposon TNT 1-94 [Tanacetum coccineum]